MEFNMHNSQEDDYSSFNLAQLWDVAAHTDRAFRKTYMCDQIIDKLLKGDININGKITVSCHFTNSTVLHFAYRYLGKIDIFNALLERGADFTIKDGNGQTVFHLMMTKDSWGFEDKKQMISSLMTAHVRFQNSINPRDDSGLSHLHGACCVNHLEAAELFLENGASIEEAVKINEPAFAGYTPLHFATRYFNFEMAQMLVRRGANVNAKTATGMCPLDLLVEQRKYSHISQAEIHEKEKIINLLLGSGGTSAVGLSSLQVAFTLKDLTIAERFLDQGAQIDYTVPIKSHIYPEKTAFHLAVAHSIEAVKMLMIRGAKVDVADAERQTPLDLCASKYSLQQMCDILSWNEGLKEICLSDGVTRLLDLIAAMKSIDEFQLFVQNIDINIVVPIGSKLWPGCTILHLVIIFSKIREYDEEFAWRDDKMIAEECLNRGLNVNAQNVKGQTAIHLAFYQNKVNMVMLLLEHLNRLDQLENVLDEGNLSYLHIACDMRDELLVEKLLANTDPNVHYRGKRMYVNALFVVEPGWTPLHVAIYQGYTSHIIADMLLRHGANLHATDANGMTPIHWIVQLQSRSYREVIDVLYNALLKNVEDRVVDGLGLSYLHIACLSNRVEVIEKLLDLGSDVNAVIEYDKHLDNLTTIAVRLRDYSNFTPIQMAIAKSPNEGVLTEVLTLLLRRGADIFDIIKCREAFKSIYQVLCDRNDVRKSVEQKLGLTLLHIASYNKNEKAIKNALNDGYDINAQISADSGIFAGCTPLHVFLTVPEQVVWEGINGHYVQINVAGLLEVLLDQGADVTIANTERDTPIHVFNKHIHQFLEVDRCKNLLLNSQQNFSLNPVNAEGLSHFHLASWWLNVEVVEKFLQHQSVDINQPIGYFAYKNPCCTPLHLVLNREMAEATADEWTSLSKIVNLLLKHGADVTARDVRGDTPLHKPAVLRSPEMRILKKLVSYGGNMKSENTRGQTPIEAFLDVPTVNANLSDYVKIFQKYGYKINSWNHLTGEGHLAKIFLLDRGNLSESSEFEKFIKSSDAVTVDNMGRTVIHNSVALSRTEFTGEIENYMYAIESFIKIGIDIDHQDRAGQTALHYATRLENIIGVKALLASGADVNINDSYGKSALAYAMEHFKYDDYMYVSVNAALELYLHIKKLKHFGVEVTQLNQNLVKRLPHIYEHPQASNSFTRSNFNNLSWEFFSQIEKTKTINVGIDSLTLFDFLSEGRVVNTYSFLPKFKRELIDDFSKSIRYNELSELSGILKLQFRKMKIRLELIDSVLNSLRKLLGFSVPGLCEQISLFLSTSDLMNLITLDENEETQA